MREIKFYSKKDFASGYVLQKIEEFFVKNKAEKELLNINDMIEIYHIKLYFDNNLYLLKWNSEEIEEYKSYINIYYKQVAQFFYAIDGQIVAEIYNEVDEEYREDIWVLLEKFKVYENITDIELKQIMNKTNFWLYPLLRHKALVQHFGAVIKEYMISDHASAELLLDEYEMQHTLEKEKLFFPKELTTLDKEEIILNYINSYTPNLNYLRLIMNIQSNKDKLVLSSRTLLCAKRRAEEEERKLFPEDSGILMEITVGFSKSQKEEILTNIDGMSVEARYSTKWLQENKDYETLLNNFIYLFQFVDYQMRCNFVNRPNQMGVLERIVYSRSRNAYLTGMAFNQTDMFSLLQIYGYYNELFSLGVRLESVIEWFFKKYLSNEFNAHNFEITMPSTHTTLLEKCTSIMPAVEFVMKQFSLFVKEGKVDFELLDIRSEHLIYGNIPSLVNKKYVYGFGDEFNYATFLLFSDQSGLTHHKNNQNSYKNYFELLRNESPKKSDHPAFCFSQLEWLIDNNYLKSDENECVSFNDEPTILVMWDLYFNEVINYWRTTKLKRDAIDKLRTKNVVFLENTLFSKPEQDYINYTLNKSQFNNGLDLRNKYSHTQPKSNDNENMHKQNYMIFLRLLILFVIKINDDFCISDQISKGNIKENNIG